MAFLEMRTMSKGEPHYITVEVFVTFLEMKKYGLGRGSAFSVNLSLI